LQSANLHGKTLKKKKKTLSWGGVVSQLGGGVFTRPRGGFKISLVVAYIVTMLLKVSGLLIIYFYLEIKHFI